jgi:hypothetical protein
MPDLDSRRCGIDLPLTDGRRIWGNSMPCKQGRCERATARPTRDFFPHTPTRHTARARSRGCDWPRLPPSPRTLRLSETACRFTQTALHPSSKATAHCSPPDPPITPPRSLPRPQALQRAARSLRCVTLLRQLSKRSILFCEAGRESRSSFAPRTNAAPSNRLRWVRLVAHLTLESAGPDNVPPFSDMQPYSARSLSPGSSSGAPLRLTACTRRLRLRLQQPP